MPKRHFDLCVIGSGPSGQRAAVQAAKLGRSVCVVERMDVVGGVAINTGTIPSKALREAVLGVTGGTGLVRHHDEAAIDRATQFATLRDSCNKVIRAEVDLVRRHFASNGIVLVRGTASFADPHTIEVEHESAVERIGAQFVLIATGTVPAKPDGIPFDGQRVITSDELLRLPEVPRSMIVVGGGVIGTEYASMLAALGVRVTLIEGRSRLLEFIDAEICEALQYHLRQAGTTLRLGEKVVRIAIEDGAGGRPGSGPVVQATLESGKSLLAECLLYAVGRQGATAELRLEHAGLSADARGRIKVNEFYQTTVPHIYACGDVIGFPALASTSMEQGRSAACHMFGQATKPASELVPYGIYSIPEISTIGWTEERLTAEAIPYEAGIAQYKEIARGQLLGDEIGMLKLLIHQESRGVLGVHVIGTGATELIHIGQAVMAFQGTVDYFATAVFNYPTLAECYKVAALNGLNKLRHT